MTNITKIGIVPGAINDYLLEDGTTIAQALTLANLTAEGYDVRMDGVPVTGATVIPNGTLLIVLAKQIKGNSEQVILKVGIVPGAINEFVVEEGTTVGEVLTLAQLERAGYDVRLDGKIVEDADFIEEDSKLLVLAKQIKGNK